MTTTTPTIPAPTPPEPSTSPPPRRRPQLQLLKEAVDQRITELQSGYLKDRSDAVAALARLRRGVGRPAAALPELWGLGADEAVHQAHIQGRLTYEQAEQAEEAAHIALSLWSLHQQSHHDQRMHRRHGLELGAAVRRLMPPGELDEPIRKRFVRAATATSPTMLAQRLREIVVLLRREAIPLDYGLLADQLYTWQQRPEGTEKIRRSWGRSFHAHREKTTAADGTPGASGSADASQNTDTTTSKDDTL
ncbi:type I-E CRISPR-associated protein Cse2/CasB [Streptomyces verrucosisporus]|uniref:type I-E CRISPR-associated protein Cse2/CasB n=1 Tax=Streptomyces verrucosisporus TaxID=1695161 RepID=UPI0019D15CD1|nr:type I-E CRISPR-associated protein Cse2/CasB [Streptomyces verrucosisporus]MBN3933039.1 type I-E CRISPR-associated protein Cse2/CasB [Streptomyces verrucosisporus]